VPGSAFTSLPVRWDGCKKKKKPELSRSIYGCVLPGIDEAAVNREERKGKGKLKSKSYS
jgi:hypothetical protein